MSVRVAAIDVGSDSTRMLIADVGDGEVRTVSEHAVITRLGTGVDATRRLSAGAVAATDDALATFATAMQEAGCTRVAAVLTSAVRDASDGPAFAGRLHARNPSWEIRVLSGDEESWLVFRGATLGERIDGPTLVIDIGGGSTELAVGTSERLLCRGSADVGTLRLGERHVDPGGYTPATRAAMGRDIAAEIAREVPEPVRRATVAGLVTATTPTWRRALKLFETTGGRLEREGCEMLDRNLWKAGGPTGLEELTSDRVETIAVGLSLLVEAMRSFDLPGLRLVERDLLQGLALEAAVRQPAPV